LTVQPIRSEAKRAARGCCARRWAVDRGLARRSAVIEVMLNPDGRLWVDRLGEGSATPARRWPPLTASASSAWSRIMSASRFMPQPPRLGRAARGGERFEGLLPPVVAARPSPSASPPSRCSRSTIMRAPGSCRRPRRRHARWRRRPRQHPRRGRHRRKTTLVNALLAEVAKTTDRIVLIEDTRELQCAAPNLVAMRTKDGVVSLSDLVRSSLRLRPIASRSARCAAPRRSTSSKPGAPAIPAASARSTPEPRSARCAVWSSSFRRPSSRSRALLAETIDLIAVLVRDGHGRRLAELARVEGLDPRPATTASHRFPTPARRPQ
jgi:type IV secretion system protein VirB11